MRSLEAIIKKYKKLQYNEDNYGIGGGLSDSGKKASKRHEDALLDKGKLTLGKAVQMFKKATGIEDTEYVKEMLQYAVPKMEWHHAGFLPKAYGGGMKKTYFLNSTEIVMIATNWEELVDRLAIKKQEARIEEERKRNREQIKQEFLARWAKKLVRVENPPKWFYEIDREMKGKYGWFSSYGKSYNLKEYYTGWAFRSEKKYKEFLSI